ncbi:MAG TPA: glycosyltransferase family A protein [Streptosporangiaceae bacterium]|jgi:glycosyltransferase involved in cell wall biosynthesis|nr:glycosyltransferase family A protein [Streptosporangiaceae bacterium]
MPEVSIISPTYQHSAFIGDCIRSVLAQTVQDWEMIIVDDGSGDETAEIAESFDDPRIVVLRRPHEGVAGLGRSYASALERARGTFVAVLECDDTWPATKLEHQLPLFGNPDVVLTYGSAGLMDESGCVYARHRHAPRGNIGNNDPVGTIIPALADVNFIVSATVMLRREEAAIAGGRVALLQGRWREAAAVFGHLLRTGEPRTRLVATVGLLCASSRTDMERLISGAGRHSLPSRRHLASHRVPGAPAGSSYFDPT